MKISPFIIERFAKWVIGGVPFESMKRIVLALNDADVPNEQKRSVAFEQFSLMGYALAGFLINLGIELAVAWAKQK